MLYSFMDPVKGHHMSCNFIDASAYTIDHMSIRSRWTLFIVLKDREATHRHLSIILTILMMMKSMRGEGEGERSVMDVGIPLAKISGISKFWTQRISLIFIASILCRRAQLCSMSRVSNYDIGSRHEARTFTRYCVLAKVHAIFSHAEVPWIASRIIKK